MTAPHALPSPLASTDWLEANLDAPDLRILDCTIIEKITDDGYAFASGEEEYVKSHVPGAAFCDVLARLGDPDVALPLMMPKPDAFAAVMEDLGVGGDTRVIIYDRGAHSWAARVWWSLKTFGFDNAAVLNGGWKKWIAENRPVSDAPASYPRGSFTPRYRPELIASKEDVLDVVENGGATLVHSLSAAEFVGETVRLPRPGRIAGSVNAPAGSLVDLDAFTYRDNAEIERAFAEAGVSGTKPIITYCGGGVAACSNALALTALGYDKVAVYDGSLAEWTADPDAPMETG